MLKQSLTMCLRENPARFGMEAIRAEQSMGKSCHSLFRYGMLCFIFSAGLTMHVTGSDLTPRCGSLQIVAGNKVKKKAVG